MKTQLISLLAIAVLAATGCKKEDKKKPEEKPTAGKTTQEEKPAPEPKEWTAADTMKRVDECTGFYNAGDMDKLASCFGESGTVTFVDYIPPMEHTGQAEIAAALKEWKPAFPDSKSEPQLVLVNGNNYAIIALNTGTHSGEMKGMPATNKKTSMYGAMIGTLDDKGNISQERHLGDQSTMMHQLGMAPNPMAPDSEEGWPDTVRATAEANETEAANVEMLKGIYEAVSKKDTKAIAAALADDVTFRWVPSKEKVEGKDAYMKGIEQYFAMQDTVEKTVKESWGAGDWVVTVVETKAKLAKDIPGFKKTKGKEYNTTQFEFIQLQDGKIKNHWIFDNSLAMLVQVGAVDPSKFAPGAAAGDAKKGGDKPDDMKKKK